MLQAGRIVQFIRGCSLIIRALTVLLLEVGAALLLIIFICQILALHR